MWLYGLGRGQYPIFWKSEYLQSNIVVCKFAYRTVNDDNDVDESQDILVDVDNDNDDDNNNQDDSFALEHRIRALN